MNKEKRGKGSKFAPALWVEQSSLHVQTGFGSIACTRTIKLKGGASRTWCFGTMNASNSSHATKPSAFMSICVNNRSISRSEISSPTAEMKAEANASRLST